MAEKDEIKLLQLSNAPHIATKDSVTKIMWTVVIALMPSAVYSAYISGIKAVILYSVAIGAAIAAEAVCQLLLKKKVTVLDGSAVITGLLVAMNVPVNAPWWIVLIGSFFAIVIAKQIFGGLGFNIFNPALAARAFLMVSWPVYMTTGWQTFGGSNILSGSISNSSAIPGPAFDALTQATPLALFKDGPAILQRFSIGVDALRDILYSSDMIQSLFIGNVGGCLGETSALLLLAGGLFLMIRKVITWHIPAAYIGTVALLFLVYFLATGEVQPYTAVAFQVLAGGLFLGAFFMATDMVTSPITYKGMLIFGAGCGVLTFIIRVWGGYPEGVSYSILLMNAVVPLIDRYVKPKVFGTTEKQES